MIQKIYMLQNLRHLLLYVTYLVQKLQYPLPESNDLKFKFHFINNLRRRRRSGRRWFEHETGLRMTSPAKSLQNYSSLKLAKTPGLNAPDIYLKVQNLWGQTRSFTKPAPVNLRSPQLAGERDRRVGRLLANALWPKTCGGYTQKRGNSQQKGPSAAFPHACAFR